MWRFFIHDSMTGNFLSEVFPSDGSWTRRLNGEGSGQHSFQVRDGLTGFDRATYQDLLQDNNRIISVSWDDGSSTVALYAGLILSSSYDLDSGVVTVQHSEIRTFARQRLTFGVSGYADGDLSFANKSASGAVRAILNRMVQWSPKWVLPIVPPADGEGDITKEWKRYQIKTINDCLAEIESEGWEIDFPPTLDASYKLSFPVRVGKPISGGLVDFNLTADKHPLTDMKVKSDGSKRLTGVFVTGNGTGEDLVSGWTGSAGDSVIPIRDSSRAGGSERDTAVLTRVAEAYFDEWRNPVVSWSFKVQLEDVSASQVTVCSRIRLITSGDPWIDDGARTLRVISLSGDMTLAVTPGVQ